VHRVRRRGIAFCVWDFAPAVGGTVRQTRTQAGALAARGHPVAVLTHRHEAAWPAREHAGGLPVRRLGPPGGADRRTKAATVAALTRRLGRARGRVAVVQVLMDPDLALAPVAAGLGRRTVLTWATRGDAEAAFAGRRGALHRRLLGPCAHVALTPAMAADLAALGLTADVIPVPVDTDRFRPPSPAERAAARARAGLAGDEPLIAFVGHLEPRKGADRLVAALARLPPGARLVLIGRDGGSEPALRAQVAAAGLHDRVAFTGPVDDVPERLWAADVLVLPSEREGMPNALLEALAAGVPCVAPASAGGDEVLAGGAGIVPPSREPADLAAALAPLLADPAARAALAVRGRQAAAAWSPAAVADRYEALYRRRGLLAA